MKLMIFFSKHCLACARLNETVQEYLQLCPGAAESIYCVDIAEPQYASIVADYDIDKIPASILVREEDPVPDEVRRREGVMFLPEFESFLGGDLDGARKATVSGSVIAYLVSYPEPRMPAPVKSVPIAQTAVSYILTK